MCLNGYSKVHAWNDCFPFISLFSLSLSLSLSLSQGKAGASKTGRPRLDGGDDED